MIALRFESASSVPGYTALVGQISVLDGAPDPPSPPSGLFVDEFSQVNDTLGTIRLKWTHSADPAYAYYVYRVNPDSTRTFLGGSPNNAYFVPEIVRVGSEETTVIEVRAIGPDFSLSNADTTSVTWVTTGVEESVSLFQLSLAPGRPNPFSTSTVIEYTVPGTSMVGLHVFSMDGRLVETIVEDQLPAGSYSSVWAPEEGCCAGMYFIRLRSGEESRVEKCILLRR
jgi:hypothetical protein